MSKTEDGSNTISKEELQQKKLTELKAWLENNITKITKSDGRKEIEEKIFDALKKEEPTDKTANYNTAALENQRMKEVIHNIVLETVSKSETSTFKDKFSATSKYLFNEITKFAKSIFVTELDLDKKDQKKLDDIRDKLANHTKSSSKKAPAINPVKDRGHSIF